MREYLSITKQNSFDTSKEFDNNFQENSSQTRRNHKIKVLVDALRMVSEDFDISKENLIIPDECEKYGFVEGKQNLGNLLHFLADMIEE